MFKHTPLVFIALSYFPRSFFLCSFSPFLFTCGFTPSFSSFGDSFSPLFHVSHLLPSLQLLIIKIFPGRGWTQPVNTCSSVFRNIKHILYLIHPFIHLSNQIRGLLHQSRQLCQGPPAVCKQAVTEAGEPRINLQEEVCVFKSVPPSPLCTLRFLASPE